MNTAECITCGKNFPMTDTDAHIKEHYEIETIMKRSGYSFTSDFPVKITRLREKS